MRVTALLAAGGLDLDLAGANPSPRQAMPRLAELAQAHGVARLSLDGEPLVSFAEPAVDVSGVRIVPPPGAFVQASAEAEATMAALATAHLTPAHRVADLFAGIGTFALALARRSPVLAVESSQPSLDALAAAHRRASGLKRVETERRDLFAFRFPRRS
jgi:23S rRNA (uracil1939-C5)-methyltransferase